MSEKIKVVFFDDTGIDYNTSSNDSVANSGMIGNGIYFSPEDSESHHISHLGHIYTLGSKVSKGDDGESINVANINDGKLETTHAKIVSNIIGDPFKKTVEYNLSELDFDNVIKTINSLVDRCNDLQSQINNISTGQQTVSSFSVSIKRTGSTSPTNYVIGEPIEITYSNIQPTGAIVKGFGMDSTTVLDDITVSGSTISAITKSETTGTTLRAYLLSPTNTSKVYKDTTIKISKPTITYIGKCGNTTVRTTGSYIYNGSLQNDVQEVCAYIKAIIENSNVTVYDTATGKNKISDYYTVSNTVLNNNSNPTGILLNYAAKTGSTTVVNSSNTLNVSKYIVRISKTGTNESTTSYVLGGTLASINTIGQIINDLDNLEVTGYTYVIKSGSTTISDLNQPITNLSNYSNNQPHCKDLKIVYSKIQVHPKIYQKNIKASEYFDTNTGIGRMDDLLSTLTESSAENNFNIENTGDLTGLSVDDNPNIKRSRILKDYTTNINEDRISFFYSKSPFSFYTRNLSGNWDILNGQDVYYDENTKLYFKFASNMVKLIDKETNIRYIGIAHIECAISLYHK